jgi:hypothetical protein
MRWFLCRERGDPPNLDRRTAKERITERLRASAYQLMPPSTPMIWPET